MVSGLPISDYTAQALTTGFYLFLHISCDAIFCSAFQRFNSPSSSFRCILEAYVRRSRAPANTGNIHSSTIHTTNHPV